MPTNSSACVLAAILSFVVLATAAQAAYPPETNARLIPAPGQLPLVQGKFTASTDSLKEYQCPDWFRDAKFGIWAHWGPQAVPEHGDWYARIMYEEGSPDYKFHLADYGHPSTNGYKDIIPQWHAEKWNPARLMELYKKAGAHYFVAQAVHHDNFDNWNSKYHKWNAVEMGPHKDIVGLWQKEALKQGLRFGVSEHLGASFTWFQASHRSDKTGPFAGVPYDGADPKYQDLYHPLADTGDKAWYSTNSEWHQEWFARIYDVVDQYHPDLLYSDGGMPFGDVGRTLVAQFYNANMLRHHGRLEAVYNCKKVNSGEFIDSSCVQDVERGGMHDIQPYPWQTDTSTGDWFFRTNDQYKTTGQVIHLLADIVSKNGNLLLNVVQYPDGSLPPEMEVFLKEMAAWMKVNGEAIFKTRPWKIYGEGPTVVAGGNFKENYAFNANDIRFTTRGKTLYAIALGVPSDALRIKSLGLASGAADKAVTEVTLLGSREKLQWQQTPDALVIQPAHSWPAKDAVVFVIKFKR
ncbi:MAG TPA: alpha-L-fucosidase [Verrucomicrobiae bacterium]|nr:alpha-L-fucosidase [Verrucomicrobiae bacterium]